MASSVRIVVGMVFIIPQGLKPFSDFGAVREPERGGELGIEHVDAHEILRQGDGPVCVTVGEELLIPSHRILMALGSVGPRGLP